MNTLRYNRKYARTHTKTEPDEVENTLNLSFAAAAGILAFTFINGIALGYAIRKILK